MQLSLPVKGNKCMSFLESSRFQAMVEQEVKKEKVEEQDRLMETVWDWGLGKKIQLALVV